MRQSVLLYLVSLIVLSCARTTPLHREEALAPPVAAFVLSDTLPLDPDVTRGVLPNGLTYYIRVNGRPEGRAELRLAVNAGSVLEDEDQQGLAHFVEHMAFNGTEHFAKHELTDFLESIGMRFGPELNAYTSFDETVYMLHVPTESLEIVDKAFLILRDWAGGITMEDDEIDKERGVITEEWRSGRGADARINDQQYPVVYHDSKYGIRLPIGKPAVIDTCRYDTLRRFYREWYRPDLMALIAVGDFDPSSIRTLIERHFAGMTSPPDERERVFFPVPDHDSLLCVVATDPEETRTSVDLLYKGPRRLTRTGIDYRRRIVESLYQGMLNARLDERTNEADPPFLRAYLTNRPIARTKEAYTLTATVRDGGLTRGVEALLGEVARVRRDGFTFTELERQKKVALRNMERAYLERDKTESNRLVWSYVGSFLRGDALPGVEFGYQFYNDYVPGVSLAEVNALSTQWMQGSRVVAVGGPESPGNPMPTAEELGAFIRTFETDTIEVYTDSLPSQQLMEHMPAPGTIVAERPLAAVDAVEWTLSNGIRVVLKPTDFKNDEILFSAFSPGGYSLVPDSLYIPAITACEIVTEGGVGEFTKVQLEKLLAGSLVSVRPGIGDATENLSGNCSPRDLEKALQLIALYVTAPRADSVAFQSYEARQMDNVKNRAAEPEQVLQDTVTVTVNQHHFRTRPWTPAVLEELDLQRSMAVYRDRFADAGDFTFFFVGALDLEEIRPLIATYLASLPTLDRSEVWRDVGPTHPLNVVTREVHLGLEQKSRVSLAFPSELQWSSRAVHRIRSMTSVLQIRFRERIREDLGGTYGVGIWPWLSHFPRQESVIWISFGCEPGRVDELVAAVFEEISKLQMSGPDSTDLAKVKEGQRRQFQRNLEENRFWQGALYNAYLNGDPVEEIPAYPELIESLTADEIREAAVTHLDQRRYVKVALYPSEEAQEAGAR